MKRIIYSLFFLLACADDKTISGNDTHDVTDQKTVEQTTPEVEEPIGIIAKEDCQQINLGDKACNIRLYFYCMVRPVPNGRPLYATITK